MITQGSGLETIDVEDELNKIADFRSIGSPSKISRCIELVFSPAKANGIVDIGCNGFTFTSGDTDVKKMQRRKSLCSDELF